MAPTFTCCIHVHMICTQGAVERGAKRIRCHVLTDGRDVPDGSSVKFVSDLEAELEGLNKVGSACVYPMNTRHA